MFRVDTCEKIAPNNENCKSFNESLTASNFSIDYLVISRDYNPQKDRLDPDYVEDGGQNLKRYNTLIERIHLHEGSNIVVNQLVQRKKLTKSGDFAFGTDYFKVNNRTYYDVETQSVFNSGNNPHSTFFEKKGYFNAKLTQKPTYIEIHAVPQDYLNTMSTLGGFVTLITTVSGWAIASYQRF